MIYFAPCTVVVVRHNIIASQRKARCAHTAQFLINHWQTQTISVFDIWHTTSAVWFIFNYKNNIQMAANVHKCMRDAYVWMRFGTSRLGVEKGIIHLIATNINGTTIWSLYPEVAETGHKSFIFYSVQTFTFRWNRIC